MKYVKTLGLAIGAAAVLMALVGGGTASATVLCKNNESTSICSENYPAKTEIKSGLSAGTKAKNRRCRANLNMAAKQRNQSKVPSKR